MTLHVICEDGAILRPCTDADYDSRMKLRRGKIYVCDVREARNYEFHKKFFALINCAWEFQDERSREFFCNSVEGFRKTLTIAAGHYESIYNVTKGEWQQTAKSIAFDRMSESEFGDLYQSVFDVICANFLGNATEEQFNEILRNY